MTVRACAYSPSGWNAAALFLMAFVNSREQALPSACCWAVPGRCTPSARARAPSLCRRSLRLLCGDWVPHDDGCVGGLSRSGRGRQRKRSSKINSRIPSTALDALAGADGENKFSVRQAFAGKALPIDHMKHNSSRATAAVATTVRFPREVSRL